MHKFSGAKITDDVRIGSHFFLGNATCFIAGAYERQPRSTRDQRRLAGNGSFEFTEDHAPCIGLEHAGDGHFGV